MTRKKEPTPMKAEDLQMSQKRNKKRNPIAVQLKHFKHKVIKNKKEI